MKKIIAVGSLAAAVIISGFLFLNFSSAPTQSRSVSGPFFVTTDGSCPTKIRFESTDTSFLDGGWTGLNFDARIGKGVVNSYDLGNCTYNPDGSCKTCEARGPVSDPKPGGINMRRCGENTSFTCESDDECVQKVGRCINNACTNNPSVFCQNDVTCSGTCRFYAGSGLAVIAGGIAGCVLTNYEPGHTGTIDVSTGDGVMTNWPATSRVYTGVTNSQPCPRCIANACDSGLRQGLACTPTLTYSNPDFSPTSLDCPPTPGAKIGTFELQMAPLGTKFTSATGSTNELAMELVAPATGVDPNLTSPNCNGESGFCLTANCATNTLAPDPANPSVMIPFNNPSIPTKGCRNNNDCVNKDCGGTICQNSNEFKGFACSKTSKAKCNPSNPTAALCSRLGEPSKRTACLTCDSENPAECDPQLCVAESPEKGRCQYGPISDSGNRKCFLVEKPGDKLKVFGKGSPPVNGESLITVASLFSVPNTSASAVNTAVGLPGPSRLSQDIIAGVYNPDGTLFSAKKSACPATPKTCTNLGKGKAALHRRNPTIDDNKDLFSFDAKLDAFHGFIPTVFGDLLQTTSSVAICAYDSRGLIFERSVSGGGSCKNDRPCWSQNPGRATFKDTLGKTGFTSMKLDANNGFNLDGRGINLKLPTLPIQGKLRVQITTGGKPQCWNTEFAPPFKRNIATGFDAAN